MEDLEKFQLETDLLSQIQFSKWRSHKITQSCVESVEKGEDFSNCVYELKVELCFLERLYDELKNLSEYSGVSS